MPEDSALNALQQADLPALGARVRDKRRALGLTQQDLAGAEISAAYVSRIEAGQRRPEYAVALQLAHRLNTSVEYLATGVEPVDRDRVLLTVQYAELALRSGEAEDAAQQLQAMLDRGESLGELELRTTLLLGLAREALGQLDAAAVLLEQAHDQATGVERLQVAQALSRCYREAGDLARSIQIGEQARSSAESEGLIGVDDEIRLTLTLVAAYFERGDVVYAAQLCQQAIARADVQQSPAARAAAYWNASVIAAERGQDSDALALADRALALMSEGDDQRNIARLRLQHGAILLAQDDPDVDAAFERLQEAREALVGTDASVADLARCDVELARAMFLRADYEQATARAHDAIDRVGRSAPFVAAEGEVLLGRVAAAEGDLATAQEHYRRGVASLTAAQADREVAQLWYQLGELLEQAGDDAGARDAYRSASASLGLRRTVGASVTV